ncbi:hypothetical protein CYG49_01825 [Candidatus Saccharibacteria bacterium]|nr:MAG: hypothetical protein CYG49_01825 [Candidatus Saccharibacteria bacterium]
MSSISDSVTVDTNDTKGYSLTLNNSDTSTALDNGAAGLIPAHAGTPASPSDLAVNTWGFRVDGLGAFGTGTTTETNVSTSAFTWAGIPASTSPQQIKSTTAAGTGSATTVWYGVKADGTNPDGSYIDTVTYTATVNP